MYQTHNGASNRVGKEHEDDSRRGGGGRDHRGIRVNEGGNNIGGSRVDRAVQNGGDDGDDGTRRSAQTIDATEAAAAVEASDKLQELLQEVRT